MKKIKRQEDRHLDGSKRKDEITESNHLEGGMREHSCTFGLGKFQSLMDSNWF